jgi:hypothetical protein
MSTEEKILTNQRAHLVLMLEECEKRLKEIRKTDQVPERKSKRGLSDADLARIRARTKKAFTPRS